MSKPQVPKRGAGMTDGAEVVAVAGAGAGAGSAAGATPAVSRTAVRTGQSFFIVDLPPRFAVEARR